MERYEGVRGKERVDAIASAIAASGATVINAPDPTVAPFEFEVALPNGKRLQLVCYAFTANKYRQGGRTSDEHRFQVKYGSDFDRPHQIYMDPDRDRVTLFFGFHEEWDLFIAVDPAMHNPTWFSISVEFKESELDVGVRDSWHGWERDRVSGGRRRLHPLENLTTEVLLAFKPEHFITYALFERMATGVDPGERLLMIDKIGEDLRRGGSAQHLIEATQRLIEIPHFDHALLQLFGMPMNDLLDMIAANFRLLAAVRGGVAEYHLQRLLQQMQGVSDVQKIDQDGQPDFIIRFNAQTIRIECKNVLRKLVNGAPRVDFQKTRAAKNDPCSRYYAPAQFEVLAACVHPVTEHWEFRYCRTRDLAPHKKCRDKLSDRVLVTGDAWRSDLPELLSGR